jgi:6-pyruvoyltetrahydropterin/6-carboxytetrahydropterin synthase
MEVAASHRISFAGGTQTEPLHGHNWKITVYCATEELDADGMVVDFLDIERRICGTLDHADLNEVLPFNPTTENLARWICEQIPQCYKVEVEESPGNEASYER